MCYYEKTTYACGCVTEYTMKCEEMTRSEYLKRPSVHRCMSSSNTKVLHQCPDCDLVPRRKEIAELSAQRQLKGLEGRVLEEATQELEKYEEHERGAKVIIHEQRVENHRDEGPFVVQEPVQEPVQESIQQRSREQSHDEVAQA